MTGISGIIFDMDGTLLDSETLSTMATNYGFEQVLGRSLTEEENAKLVGRPVKKILSQWFPDEGDRIYVTGRKYYDSRIKNIVAYPGVREMLESLDGKVRMAVVTSSHRSDAENLLEIAGLKNHFEFFVGQEDTTYQKPDPEPVLFALRRFRLDPERCVFVGDQPYDIIAAHEAGMVAIGVVWGSGNHENLEQYRPEKIMSNPQELLAYLNGLIS